MNEERSFLIQDLDETHLLVSADSVEMIKEQLEEEVSFHLVDYPNYAICVS